MWVSVAGGVAFIALNFFSAWFFARVGHAATTQVIGISMIGMLLNARLDDLMIFGKAGLPAMGMAGAGYATWDGVHISALYMLVMALSFLAIPEFYLSWFRNKDNAALWAQVQAPAPRLLSIVAIFTVFDSAYLRAPVTPSSFP